MASDKITKRIKDKALELLDLFPNGLRYSELHAKISAADASFNSNTVNGSIWNLDALFPDKVYKPSKGLFRLLKYKPSEPEVVEPAPSGDSPAPKIKEEDFYEPFADWLKNEIEDVTHAIPLGGNRFKDKWGTPDVVGKRESRRSDIIRGTTEIVSAEIKTETLQLITAFGQACAYKIFSNKVYLVVPTRSSDEDLDRLTRCARYSASAWSRSTRTSRQRLISASWSAPPVTSPTCSTPTNTWRSSKRSCLADNQLMRHP
ncbi:MAG: hypothetical protein U1F83_18905 [Verrucomicrobiota bacterium]